MAIEIKSGPAPVAKRRKSQFDEVYKAAAELKGGQWFEWTDPPSALTNHRKRLTEINAKLELYRDRSERVIVKNTDEVVVTQPAGPMAAVRATPIGGTVGGGGGLTREQREAAAARVRQTANGLRGK